MSAPLASRLHLRLCALAQRMLEDEAATAPALAATRRAFDRACFQHGGVSRDAGEDRLEALFASPADALGCAEQMLREAGVPLAAGLAAEDEHGATGMAAELAELGGPGAIHLSPALGQALSGRPDVTLERVPAPDYGPLAGRALRRVAASPRRPPLADRSPEAPAAARTQAHAPAPTPLKRGLAVLALLLLAAAAAATFWLVSQPPAAR